MKKGDRQKVFDKYGGKCAYCGCELGKGWHVDEIEPVRRYNQYVKDGNGNRIWDEIKKEWRMELLITHPERFHIDNQNPACASCNINKHSDTLEEFRKNIAKYLESLNLRMVQYKMAKKYGLIIETNKPVIFYFEKVAMKDNDELSVK